MFIVFAPLPNHQRHRVPRTAAAVLAALVAVAAPSRAAAQSPAATAPTSGSAQPAASTTSTQTGGAPAPFTAGWQNGFSLQTANGDYRLTIGLLEQTDGRFAVDDPLPITNTFSLRKARPIFTGRIAKYFDYRLMPDLGNGAATVQDAYFDVRFSPKFRVRAGKDKSPVGYELLVSDGALLFPERSLASSLVPNRDIGLQVQGDLAGNKVSYAIGVFNGIPDGTSVTTELDTNSDKDVAGRLVLQPFRSATTPPKALNGLGVQIGGTTGTQTGALPSFKTSVGQTFFSYAAAAGATPAATAAGRRQRVTPAVFYFYKSVGAFGEYARSTQRITRGGTTEDITNTGWDISGVWNVTGETATTGVVTPRNGFDPPTHKWGALQLVARYADLRIDQAAFDTGLAAANTSREAQQITIGANWYPVSYVKYYINFERTTFDKNGTGSRPAENVIFFRLQLAF